MTWIQRRWRTVEGGREEERQRWSCFLMERRWRVSSTKMWAAVYNTKKEREKERKEGRKEGRKKER